MSPSMGDDVKQIREALDGRDGQAALDRILARLAALDKALDAARIVSEESLVRSRHVAVGTDRVPDLLVHGATVAPEALIHWRAGPRAGGPTCQVTCARRADLCGFGGRRVVRMNLPAAVLSAPASAFCVFRARLFHVFHLIPLSCRAL